MWITNWSGHRVTVYWLNEAGGRTGDEAHVYAPYDVVGVQVCGDKCTEFKASIAMSNGHN